MSPSIQVQYKNGMKDILAFAIYHYPRSPITLGSIAIAQLVFGIPLWKDAQEGGSILSLVFAEILLFLLLILALSAGYSLIIMVSMLSRRNRIFFAPHTLTASDEHLVDETSFAKGEYQWSAIQKVAVTRKRIFLYITRDAAIVIPRASFATVEVEEAFISMCGQRSSRAA